MSFIIGGANLATRPTPHPRLREALTRFPHPQARKKRVETHLKSLCMETTSGMWRVQIFYPIVDIPKDLYGVLGLIFTIYGSYLMLKSYLGLKKLRIQEKLQPF